MMWSPLHLSGVCLLHLVFLFSVDATRLVKHDVNFVPDIVLRVTVDSINLNCQERLSTLVNGTYPGPPIYLQPEQTTWIRVYNDADVNTTMHWHGLSQSLFPFADGSPQASQWPIPPGHFYDYELYAPADLAGTSFYHSHVGFQAVTAVGPLIVKDASTPPYHYDDEIILTLGDFYPQQDHEIEEQLTASPYTWTGDPISLLINGQSGNAPNSENPNPSDVSCQPHVFNVDPDKTYRVRVLGAASISLVTFGFEGYDNLTIIETDNSYVEPVETDHIQVDGGQRFSFVFHTKSSAELQGKTFSWIQFETRAGDTVVTGWAKLNYSRNNSVKRRTQPRSPESLPSSNQNANFIPSSPILTLPYTVSDWLEYTFQSLSTYGTAPSASSVTRRIVITTAQILNQTTGLTTFPFNNAPWFEGEPLGPTTHVPYLVEILSNGTINNSPPSIDRALANAQQPGLDPVTQTYPTSVGEVLEIVWQNSASIPGGVYGVHPMHAHGGPYWDMGSGSGMYSPEAHEALLAQHGGWAGSRRDTTELYTYSSSGQEAEVDGWRVWRLRVTEQNVGVWMMHCHILQHMIMGQQTVWVFGTPDEIVAHAAPVNSSLDGYFTYGGDVMGKLGGEVTVASKFA